MENTFSYVIMPHNSIDSDRTQLLQKQKQQNVEKSQKNTVFSSLSQQASNPSLHHIQIWDINSINNGRPRYTALLYAETTPSQRTFPKRIFSRWEPSPGYQESNSCLVAQQCWSLFCLVRYDRDTGTNHVAAVPSAPPLCGCGPRTLHPLCPQEAACHPVPPQRPLLGAPCQAALRPTLCPRMARGLPGDTPRWALALQTRAC